MTEKRLLRLLSIVLRILRRSRQGIRLRLRKREQVVLRMLIELSLSRKVPESLIDLHEDFDCLVSLATWELFRTHGKALPKLRKHLEICLKGKRPGEERIGYLIALLTRVRELVEREGLYLLNRPRKRA